MEYGNNKKAIDILKKIIENDFYKIGKNRLLKGYQYLALALFSSGKEVESSDYITKIYLLQEDFLFDPVMIPPQFIEFAETIYQKKRSEILSQRNLVSALGQLRSPERYRYKNRKKALYKNFIPFGVGQFQNGHEYKGVFLLSTQATLLTINLVTYGLLKYYQRDDYTFEDPELASTGKGINSVAFFLLIGTYLYGMIDALIYYNVSEKIKVIQASDFNVLPYFGDGKRMVFFEWNF